MRQFDSIFKRLFLAICLLFVVHGVAKCWIHTLTFVEPTRLISTSTTPKLWKSTTNKTVPCVAVLVEFRSSAMIFTVVHNVQYHLPASWRIQIFHGKENAPFLRDSTLAPLIESGKIILTQLDSIYGRNRTTELLTSPNFWNQVQGEKVLLFQIDSMMCSNSRHTIDEFLQYDYVGAPWDPSWFSFGNEQLVGNGGFSLRTRSKILALLEKKPYNGSQPEDVWFSKNLRLVDGKIPPVDIAKKFAVETVPYDRPLAAHTTILLCHVFRSLIDTCSEAKLVISKECSG